MIRSSDVAVIIILYSTFARMRVYNMNTSFIAVVVVIVVAVHSVGLEFL